MGHLCQTSLLLSVALCASALADWTQLGRTASRAALIDGEVPSLAAPAWVRSVDGFGNTISFSVQGGLSASDRDVYAVGKVNALNQTFLFRISRADGSIVWQMPIPAPVSDSVTTPTIDSRRGTVLVATGTRLTAVRIADMQAAWQVVFSRALVNVSPAVTTDRPGRDRAFVTDFDGFGTSASLHCINLDAFDAATNPYQPGQIVWSAPIGGSSGNSPAYSSGLIGGVVLVASVGEYEVTPGRLFAFDVDGGTPGNPPTALWIFENPVETGFFGGLSIAPGSLLDSRPPSAFAASYAFSGGMLSANIVKLNACNGSLAWSAPANRTGSTPIPLGDGRIALSGGINGFGTVRNLTLFADQETHASSVWTSSPSFVIGGRLIQPIAARTVAGLRIVCGASPVSSNDVGYVSDLYVVDPSLSPGVSGFVVDHFSGGGGGTIVTDGNLYCVGTGGLYAFGPSIAPDVDGDGRVTIGDLHAWEQGMGARDVDRSGAVDGADRAALLKRLRGAESVMLVEERR